MVLSELRRGGFGSA